jgi:hypothetical protein
MTAQKANFSIDLDAYGQVQQEPVPDWLIHGAANVPLSRFDLVRVEAPRGRLRAANRRSQHHCNKALGAA